MVALTENLLGNTLIYTIAMGVFSIGITVYNLILQYRQARVKALAEDQLVVLKKIKTSADVQLEVLKNIKGLLEEKNED